MAHSHGNHGTGGSDGGHGHQGHGLASAAAAAACTHTGRGIMSNFLRRPLVLLGIGVVAGYYAYKYRKEIVATATKYTEMGKDFALQQKENLEDMVAEAQEAGEEETPKEKG